MRWTCKVCYIRRQYVKFFNSNTYNGGRKALKRDYFKKHTPLHVTVAVLNYLCIKATKPTLMFALPI